VALEPSTADAVARCNGVAVCVAALAAPEHLEFSKPKAFALKSSMATGGAEKGSEDTFSPTLRAARVLKAMCGASETARCVLATPPKCMTLPPSLAWSLLALVLPLVLEACFTTAVSITPRVYKV
jgi:hypothetical protein